MFCPYTIEIFNFRKCLISTDVLDHIRFYSLFLFSSFGYVVISVFSSFLMCTPVLPLIIDSH